MRTLANLIADDLAIMHSFRADHTTPGQTFLEISATAFSAGMRGNGMSVLIRRDTEPMDDWSSRVAAAWTDYRDKADRVCVTF